MRKDHVLVKIRESFYYEKRFEDVDIVSMNELYKDYEGNEVAYFFKNKSNSEIKLHDLLEGYKSDHTACINFMKPSAASYFIGAYMHLGVENNQLGNGLRANLMYLFSGALLNSDEDERWFNEITNSYSVLQRSVIRDFIDYVEENDGKSLSSVDFLAAQKMFE